MQEFTFQDVLFLNKNPFKYNLTKELGLEFALSMLTNPIH